MSRKAIIALCVAILIPLISYFIVKYASENAIVMPRHYFYDSVSVKMKDGKQVSDTIWHRVKDISLTNQLGEQVSLSQLNGKVIVADFFFTHCPSICPTLTRNFKKMQDALNATNLSKSIDTGFVQLLSFSVDPERDSVPVLRKYADKYGVNPDNWWLLTGEKKKIYDFSIDELKLGLEDGEGVDSNFIHTQKLVVLDKYRVVRGYYNGLDSVDLAKLAQDIVFILLEKDKNSQSIFIELKPLFPLFVLILAGTAIAVYFASRK